VGVGLFVTANGKRDDVVALSKSILEQDHRRCVGPEPLAERCAEVISTARDSDTFHNIAVGTFVGAGALAVGALTYLLWPAPNTKKTGTVLRAAPVLGTSRAGMSIEGAF